MTRVDLFTSVTACICSMSKRAFRGLECYESKEKTSQKCPKILLNILKQWMLSIHF